MQQKIKRIADTVHGNIQISSIEKDLISQHAFNRLHNILQNSTAFLTYPSNQTKRFEHSVGVMHLAGEMFYNSISNADEEVIIDFMDQVIREVENINTAKGDILRERFKNNVDKEIKNFANADIKEPLYKKKTPIIINQKHKNYYYLMYQSIRSAALLHDLGHPPFSHVTENALNDVINEIKKSEKPTNRMKYFLEIMEPYIDEKNNRLELHEKIGNNISNRLLETMSRDIENHMQLFSIYVHQITIKILTEQDSEKNSFFKNIHSIIASPIDSDRLDYVTRDLMNSGFRKGQIEYDRLLSSVKMVIKEGHFYFIPSARTLSTIEDFYQRYNFLYKYAIFHHRVIKTDLLLGKVIYDLAISYLKETIDENDENDSSLALPIDISGLWKPVKVVHSDKKYFNLITQWDDAWLLTVLRQKFYGEYQEKEDLIIAKQLEEILSNKKHYHSLIKRMNDFLIIDEHIIKNIDISRLKNIEESRIPVIPLIQGQYNMYHNEKKEWKNKAPLFGFIYSSIKKLFGTLQKSNDFRNLFEKAIEEASKECNINYKKELLVSFKELKTGLEKEKPFLQAENDIIALNEVSRIEHDLNLSKDVFPQIFLYILLEKGRKLDESRFLATIGSHIGMHLTKYFEEMF